MVSGSDALFALSLTFFKENLATYVAVLVLLPLSAFLNWRLSLVLVALVCVFAGVTALVIRHTQAGQRRAEAAHSELAGRAQDALANVVAVQSFGRLQAEARAFAEIVENVIAPPVPGAELVGAGDRADPRVQHARRHHHRRRRRAAAHAWPGERGRDRLVHGLLHPADRAAGSGGELRQQPVHARARHRRLLQAARHRELGARARRRRGAGGDAWRGRRSSR